AEVPVDAAGADDADPTDEVVAGGFRVGGEVAAYCLGAGAGHGPRADGGVVEEEDPLREREGVRQVEAVEEEGSAQRDDPGDGEHGGERHGDRDSVQAEGGHGCGEAAEFGGAVDVRVERVDPEGADDDETPVAGDHDQGEAEQCGREGEGGRHEVAHCSAAPLSTFLSLWDPVGPTRCTAVPSVYGQWRGSPAGSPSGPVGSPDRTDCAPAIATTVLCG